MHWEEVMALPRIVDEVTDWRHRPENRYTEGGRALVSKVSSAGHDLKSVVREAVDLIGGVRRALDPSDRVLLKANFVAADPSPVSTDIAFIRAVVELLHEGGITKLALGERSGFPRLPTADVFEATGLTRAAREMDLRLIPFDPGPWMEVRPGGRWWKNGLALPAVLKGFDKIVYLPNIKHHRNCGFTMSLKLNVGMTHPAEMREMHADTRVGRPDEPMFEKMLELSLPVGPDLIIMDGRKAMVTGGPVEGEAVEPGVVMASGDRIALDVEGIKVLQTFPRDNLIQGPVWENHVVRHAIDLGLGVRGEGDYRVVGAG